AFGIRVQALNSKTGAQILPAIMSDNYFTLFKGESKEVLIEFDESLLKTGEKPVIKAETYNK
ncbi:MAG: glycoside hydrolase family 2 protein, partial [Bacteroidota bacterium]